MFGGRTRPIRGGRDILTRFFGLKLDWFVVSVTVDEEVEK